MREGTRLGVLVGVMALVSAGVGASSIWILYEASAARERDRLISSAVERADDVAVALSVSRNPHGALQFLERTHPLFSRFGETGEFTIARRSGGKVEYVLPPRIDGSDAPKPPTAGESEAMNRALLGHTGILETVNEDGLAALAAHAPVRGFPYGVVVTVEKWEVRAPFLRAALAGGAVAALAALLGALVALRLLEPVARRLRERERLFRAAFNSTYQLYGLLDKDGTVREINRTAHEAAGAIKSDVLGRKLWEIPTWKLDEEARARIRRSVESAVAGETVRYQTEVRGIDGGRISLDVSMRPLENNAALDGMLLVEARDVTESKRHERALRILSTCNQTLIRAHGERELLENICRTIQQIGGFPMVWVGYAEQGEAKRVRPVVSAGDDRGYLERIRVTWDESDSGRGPVGTAIRTGRPCVIRDTQLDERFNPWQQASRDCGFASLIALPLRSEEGRAFGALAIYANERDAFDTAEQALLEELADDLAYGLATLRARQERNDALIELRDRDAMLRGFYEATAVMLASVELAGNDLVCHLANGQWAKTLGMAPEDVAGRSLREIGVEESDIQALLPWFVRCQETGQALTAEFCLTRGQDKSWYQASISPIGQSGFRSSLFTFAAVDITERRRAETALADSEERFRLAFECAGAGMLIIGLDGRIVRANASLERMLGYKEAELVGRLAAETLHPDDRDRSARALRKLLAGEVSLRRGAARGIHRDGREVWLDITTVLMRDTEGRPIHFVTHAQDVTERRQAEKARRRAELLLSGVVNSSSDAVMALRAVRDSAGAIVDFECLLANTAAQRMTGLSLVGTRMIENGPPEHAETLFRRCADVVETGAPLEEEYRVERRGRTEWFQISAVKLEDGVAVSFADITERKDLQQQFLHVQKMEAVGRLAGGMAHDFNNVLTAILGLSELALLDAEPGSEVYRQIEEIREAAQRAAALTRQLLVFSRRQHVQPGLLALDEAITGVDRIVRRLIGEDIELQTVLADGLWPVRADRTQIEQVLMNLAVNARDAMPGGGTLTIKARNAVLHASPAGEHAGAPAGEYVLLFVSDTGHGMTPEVRARVFEPFFTTKESGKGTGLGLATVYGIVQQCGGFVRVESEVGRGTTFLIYLPRAAQDAPARPPRPEVPGERGGHETILLVEDDEHVRRLTRHVLESKGYRLIVACDGEEAWDLARRHHDELHLVLSDVVMPRMSGIELARLLRENFPQIRLILMSGYNDQSAEAQDLLGPNRPFLQKPFSRSDLLRTIRSVLEAPLTATSA